MVSLIKSMRAGGYVRMKRAHGIERRIVGDRDKVPKKCYFTRDVLLGGEKEAV